MKLFEWADRYCAESDWKDMALLKFCLFSMGVMAGMQVPKKRKKAVYILCGAVFAVTYVPLMAKYFRIVKNSRKETL